MESNFLIELHPKIVHFPIALLSVYALLEITGIVSKKEFISKCALLLMCLGVVSAFFAVLTGNEAFSAFQSWTKESTELINEHQTYATFLVWFSLFVGVLRLFLVIKNSFKGSMKFVFIVISIVILYLVYETGEHGGELVSKFGVGTEFILKQKSQP